VENDVGKREQAAAETADITILKELPAEINRAALQTKQDPLPGAAGDFVYRYFWFS
jgi:hypothetical protein